ncbi:pectin acetylesterase 7-like [Actinia tenebrosa]|uniref:Pectin acetylesterase 7-like n=1 Tax=Actinia tenebrosa TaxID=6105 RepID=A0A6P8I370_ACTTE|nr:pectin acetylesterase 7-like [Actinia tenebrosa]
MRKMRVWILLIILGLVLSGNTNSVTEKLNKKRVQRSNSRALTTMIQQDQTSLKSEEIDIVTELFNVNKKSADLILGNLLAKHRRTAYKPRERRENMKENGFGKKRGNGFQDFSRRTSSIYYKEARVDEARKICRSDANTDLYTLKRYPKPLEYERIILKDARSSKALCLDGTPAVYFLRKSKARNQGKRWIIFFPGGAWCSSKEPCFTRSQTDLGSSKYFPSLAKQGGILSSNRSKNPYFYDWNVLYLQYCDGSSFMGNVEQPVLHGKVYLYSRGFTILNAFLDEIIPKYLSKAREVVVVGISAGALGVLANADLISSRIPQAIKVHFVSDGGFFVDVRCRDKQYVFSRWMKSLHVFHNITSALLQDCMVSFKRQEWMCLMPENILRFTKSSIAIINSMTDAWQLVNLKGAECGYAPRSCDNYELGLAQQLRNSMTKSLNPITGMENISLFLYSCIRHCMIHQYKSWRFLKVGSMTLEKFVYDFVSGEKNVQLIEDRNGNPVCTL